MHINYVALFKALGVHVDGPVTTSCTCPVCNATGRTLSYRGKFGDARFRCSSCMFVGNGVQLVAAAKNVPEEVAAAMLSPTGALAGCLEGSGTKPPYSRQVIEKLGRIGKSTGPARLNLVSLRNGWCELTNIDAAYMPDDARYCPDVRNIHDCYRRKNQTEYGVSFLYRSSGWVSGVATYAGDMEGQWEYPYGFEKGVFPEQDAMSAPGGLTIIPPSPLSACRLMGLFRSITGRSPRIFHAKGPDSVPAALRPAGRVVLWCDRGGVHKLVDALKWYLAYPSKSYIVTTSEGLRHLENVVRRLDAPDSTLRDWLIAQCRVILDSAGEGGLATALDPLLSYVGVPSGHENLLRELIAEAGADLGAVLGAERKEPVTTTIQQCLVLKGEGVELTRSDGTSKLLTDACITPMYAYEQATTGQGKVRRNGDKHIVMERVNADGTTVVTTVNAHRGGAFIRNISELDLKTSEYLSLKYGRKVSDELEAMAEDLPVLDPSVAMKGYNGTFPMPRAILLADGTVQRLRIAHETVFHRCYKNIDKSCTEPFEGLAELLDRKTPEALVTFLFGSFLYSCVSTSKVAGPYSSLFLYTEDPRVLSPVFEALQSELGGDASSHALPLKVAGRADNKSLGCMPIIMGPDSATVSQPGRLSRIGYAAARMNLITFGSRTQFHRAFQDIPNLITVRTGITARLDEDESRACAAILRRSFFSIVRSALELRCMSYDTEKRMHASIRRCGGPSRTVEKLLTLVNRTACPDIAMLSESLVEALKHVLQKYKTAAVHQRTRGKSNNPGIFKNRGDVIIGPGSVKRLKRYFAVNHNYDVTVAEINAALAEIGAAPKFPVDDTRLAFPISFWNTNICGKPPSKRFKFKGKRKGAKQ